jgi:Domain of unknown function (DUF4340)
MSSRQLVRMAGVLAAAIILWGILAITRRAPSDAVKTLTLPKIDTAAVDTVVLTKRTDTARLVRATHTQWRVNGYPAATDGIAALLRGLADTTGWSEQVAESRASEGRFGVSADSGQDVRVTAHGRTVLDVVTGGRTSDYTGVYVRPAGQDAVYAVHGALADGVTRSITDWRDKHIVSVSPDSVATIAVERGSRSYTLRRDSHGWHFANGGPADSSAVASLLAEYRDLTAVGFATPAQADTANFTRAPRHARLTRANGTTLASLEFDSTAAHVWARADTGGAVFQLTSWTLGQLTPADSTLKAKTPHKK